GCDGGRLPEADTQEKGITGENDDVHTRTYRPFSCGGESRYVIFYVRHRAVTYPGYVTATA
ncbi:hypothetical protein, partial [Escherichia coli]|uniref:hypothetical protein n=4 Tax=Enterobacterales TaxID=91347 RepID=UPI001BC98D45